jgi:single-strand DNA-binding protein
MNEIIIIGNATNAPELRKTGNGTAVTGFTVAVNRRFEKTTDFFKVNAWRGLAEVCAKYIEKGSRVAVIGELQMRSYEAKDGTTRVSVEVSADEVEFLSSPATRKAETVTLNTTSNGNAFDNISIDDLPWGS